MADLLADYLKIKEAAGVVDLSGHGKIEVTGDERVEWLNGMVTNDVAGLAVGESCRALAISVKGRLVADLRVHRHERSLILETEAGLAPATIAALDKYLISEDAAMADVTDQWAIIGVHGGQASEVRPPDGGFVANVQRTAWDGFDIWVPAGEREAALAALGAAAARVGGGLASFEALEVARVEWGDPRQGPDMNDEMLALEAGLWGIISTSKGCYVGQEVIARVDAQGHVNRILVGLLLDGATPVPPRVPVIFDGKQVGVTASSVVSPTVGQPIALAYIHWRADPEGTRVAVKAPSGDRGAVVANIPFVGSNPAYVKRSCT